MIEYSYKTDFKLVEEWKENVEQNAPFIFTYYQPIGGKTLVASFQKGIYKNCKRLQDGNIIILFDDHGFGPGKILCKKEYFLTDADFESGICNLVVEYDTGIVLKTMCNLNSLATTKMPAFYQQGAAGEGNITDIDGGTC